MAEVVDLILRSSRQNTEIQVQEITQENLTDMDIIQIYQSSRNSFGLLLI